MIKNRALGLYLKTSTLDTEQVQVESWAWSRDIEGNFQPRALTQTELQAWGLTDLGANAKLFLIDLDTTLKEGSRLFDGTDYFEIRGLNHWPIHTEIIMVPVQGLP